MAQATEDGPAMPTKIIWRGTACYKRQPGRRIYDSLDHYKRQPSLTGMIKDGLAQKYEIWPAQPTANDGPSSYNTPAKEYMTTQPTIKTARLASYKWWSGPIVWTIKYDPAQNI